MTPFDHFSVRWTGYFVVPATGEYQFCTASDDGVRLFVDDTPVIADWVDIARLRLVAGGRCKVRLEYHESTETATVRFGVMGPDADMAP